METQGIVKNWGNSGGILVPKEWLGKQVKVKIVERTDEIKREVLKIVDNYLDEVQGIYLVGSYARGDQEKNSDIDIIIISETLRKAFSSGKYHIETHSLKWIKNSLQNNPIMIYPRLNEAKTIINSSLIQEIMSDLTIKKESFKEFIEDCRRVIAINKEYIELDKLNGEILESAEAVIYSLFLRLRGIFFIKTILEERKGTKELFKNWLSEKSKMSKKQVEELYQIYRALKDDQKIDKKIKIKDAEILLDVLGKEVKSFYA